MQHRPIRRAARLLALTSLAAAGLTACSDGASVALNQRDSAPTPGQDAPPAETAYRLQLLHFADMDGSTDALDNVVNFSKLVSAFRSVPTLTDNTLVVSSGDNFIPGPRFFAAGVRTPATQAALGVPGNGRGDIVFVNAFGTAASALGNHDLDQGTEAFAGLIAADEPESGPAYPGAEFPYLSTNTDFAGDDNLEPLIAASGRPAAQSAGRVSGSATVEVGGQTIGLVGASTPLLASITATGGLALSPTDFTMTPAGYDALAAAIQPGVDALTARGIDKIVLLAHMQQIAIEQALAERLRGVDIIVAGGSNTLLADENDVLRAGDTAAGPYPIQLEDADGEPTLVVNVDGDYKYLGRLVVDFDADGHLLPSSLDSSVNGAKASTDAVVETLANRDLDITAPTAVTETQAALQSVLADQDGNIQGVTDVYLDGRRTQVRTEETNLGDLTADANLFYARRAEPGVQIAIKNGGGIRDDIGRVVVPPGSSGAPDLLPPQANASIGKPAGGVSQFDIAGALRFNNSLTLVTLTAAELRDVMEYAVAATTDGATPGQFPQIGGFHITFDPANTARSSGQANRAANTDGNRIRRIALTDATGTETRVLVENGMLAVPADTPIRAVFLAFTAACVPGDNYSPDGADCGDGYPLKNLGTPQRRELDPSVADDASAVAVDYDPGRSGFAATGSEQDALAEYLQARYCPGDVAACDDDSGAAFNQAETPPAEDRRIVNLAARRSAG